MSFTTALQPLLGGGLIGLSASLLLLTHGKVAGVSGIFGGLLQSKTPDRGYRVAFVLGLALAGVVLLRVSPGVFAAPATPLWRVAAAGLLVGYGTRLGNGCTSGHGVCGLSRLSIRSLVATMTFIGAGAATVFFTHHLLGAR